VITGSDERPHPPGDTADAGEWVESWSFDFATEDAALGGFVRITMRPHERRCWYWAYLVGAGRDPVMVVDDDVALPRNNSLEIRAEGLWADHVIEQALDHVSVSCEAFALRLDDPAEAFGRLWGERVGFGLDLGWETAGDVVADPPASSCDAYDVPCRVVGEVLVGDERIALDAVGWRGHSWGPCDPWAESWSSLRGRFTDGSWFKDDVRVGIDPVAFAPLVVPARSGVPSRLMNALCRVADLGSERTGAGWMAWCQPG
jgi:hypothetical protein